MTLHEIPAPQAELTLRFTRTGTDQHFTTTATGIVMDGNYIVETGTARLIARIGTGHPNTYFMPPDRRSQVWYDQLTIEPGD